MLTLTGCRDVAFQVLCERLYTVRYHWRGRSLLCTGDEHCIGCQIERPRGVFYLVANVRRGQTAVGEKPELVRGVVELCASAKLIVERSWRQFGKLCGLVVEMKRRSSKAEWSSVSACYKEPSSTIGDDGEVMTALATVLRVDDSKPGESFDAWLLRAASMHRGLMRGSELVA